MHIIKNYLLSIRCVEKTTKDFNVSTNGSVSNDTKVSNFLYDTFDNCIAKSTVGLKDTIT
jgi:hypothetical protein